MFVAFAAAAVAALPGALATGAALEGAAGHITTVRDRVFVAQQINAAQKESDPLVDVVAEVLVAESPIYKQITLRQRRGQLRLLVTAGEEERIDEMRRDRDSRLGLLLRGIIAQQEARRP